MYYATLCRFLEGGEGWQAWNQALMAMLLPGQAEDGSWPVVSYYGEHAQDSERDRVYTTAMCVLMLEVYYRYLPQLIETRGR